MFRMKTKIILKEKTLLERIKEIDVSNKLFITQRGNELTVIFDKQLTATKIQKIKDLLEKRFHITVEEVENFPESGLIG